MVSAGQRQHDVSGLTAGELERARRELQVSLSLAWPGSPVREPILAQMSAIDRELGERTANGNQAQEAPRDQDR
jgi:hypothetical protein